MVDLPSGPLSADLFEPRTWQRACEGRAFVITGAAGGLGSAMARALLSAGASVALVDRSRESLERLAQQPRTLTIEADVTVPHECAKVVSLVAGEFGRVDYLINNAGVIHVDPILDLDIDDWRRVFRVNVEGTFLMSQAALRVMCEQRFDEYSGRRGMIVNIGSRAVDSGRAFTTAYAASKAAVVHLSLSLSEAFAGNGISTAVAYPADIPTALFMGVSQRIAGLEGVSLEEFLARRPIDTAASFANLVMAVLASHGMDFNGTLVRHSLDDLAFR